MQSHCPDVREADGDFRQERRGRVARETEMGVTRPQTQEWQGPRNTGRGEKGLCSEVLGGQLSDTGFRHWPPER